MSRSSILMSWFELLSSSYKLCSRWHRWNHIVLDSEYCPLPSKGVPYLVTLQWSCLLRNWPQYLLSVHPSVAWWPFNISTSPEMCLLSLYHLPTDKGCYLLTLPEPGPNQHPEWVHWWSQVSLPIQVTVTTLLSSVSLAFIAPMPFVKEEKKGDDKRKLIFC